MGEKRVCSVPGCGRPYWAVGYCSSHYRRETGRVHTAKPVTRACEACSKVYTTKRDPARARVCSLECRWFIDDRIQKSWPLRRCKGCDLWVPKRRGIWCSLRCYGAFQQQLATPKPPRPRFHCGRCRRCGETFVDLWNDRPAYYCSTRCARSEAKLRRRAWKAEAFVAPVNRRKIFERDGWRCQICGEDLDREARLPHPWAPVLDHITPLAAGGSHEPDNVQAAHFWCNSVKSDGSHDDALVRLGLKEVG